MSQIITMELDRTDLLNLVMGTDAMTISWSSSAKGNALKVFLNQRDLLCVVGGMGDSTTWRKANLEKLKDHELHSLYLECKAFIGYCAKLHKPISIPKVLVFTNGFVFNDVKFDTKNISIPTDNIPIKADSEVLGYAKLTKTKVGIYADLTFNADSSIKEQLIDMQPFPYIELGGVVTDAANLISATAVAIGMSATGNQDENITAIKFNL